VDVVMQQILLHCHRKVFRFFDFKLVVKRNAV